MRGKKRHYNFLEIFLQTFCVAILTLPIIPVLIFWFEKDSRQFFFKLEYIAIFFGFGIMATLWISWIGWRSQRGSRGDEN
jgi:hypothetical protein